MTMKFDPQALLIVTLTFSLIGANALWGETSPPISSSGTDFMAPKRDVHGLSIGQEDVLIEEVAFTDSGRQYRRMDVGVSGTLEGWVVKEGPRGNHFTSHPEFAFTQSGNEY